MGCGGGRVRGGGADSAGSGRRLIDLTVSNPTVCGFRYDAEGLLGPLGDVMALRYDPDPRGLRAAREAVAGYYREHGAMVDADEVVLTTSTSEAYSFVFRLLCDAGDEVLIARPSYPLFDFLAELDDVRLGSYPLFYDQGWWIDFAELERGDRGPDAGGGGGASEQPDGACDLGGGAGAAGGGLCAARAGAGGGRGVSGLSRCGMGSGWGALRWGRIRC